jgi:transposase
MKRLVLENRNSIVEQIRGYLEDNSEAKYIHRLQVILLFADSEEQSCDTLGTLFGNSPRSISNWIKKINQTGDVESLRSISPSGRPSRLSEVQKEEIKMVLRCLPEKQGMQGKRWNGRLLSSHISQHYGIALNVRSCQRLLQDLTANI